MEATRAKKIRGTYTSSDHRNGCWTDANGVMVSQGHTEGFGWWRDEIKSARYGQVSRRTDYYETEADLFAMAEAGKLSWSRWS